MPFIANQLQAFAVGEHVTLVFTTVLNELVRGLVGEDEDATPADRAYRESRTSTEVLKLTDRLLGMIRECDAAIELK